MDPLQEFWDAAVGGLREFTIAAAEGLREFAAGATEGIHSRSGAKPPELTVRSRITEVPRQASLVIERVPEGGYLGTSEEIPGLAVECDTAAEAAMAAEEIALDLLETEQGHSLDPRPKFTITYKN